MAKTIHSGNLTFIDLTDSKKVDVHISSNLPTTQIFDGNTNTQTPYSPDWASTPLQLTLTAYADSTNITSILKTDDITWYRQIGSGAYSQLQKGGTKLTISQNELIMENIGLSTGVVSYICSITYNSKTFENKITFARVDTGINGSNGSPAPSIQAQYSVDGQTGWTSTLNAATHKYIKYSYDGGKTWTTSIKMVGEDGTSVKIKGTATSKTPVSGTSYYTLMYNSATITGATLGDSYLLDGHLYVCVDSRDGNDHFMDVGQIQGPPGNDGNSEYVYIRYAPASPSDSNMTITPSSTTTHIGICVSTSTTAPSTAISYTWSKFVGDSAKSIILSGDSQVFKVDKSGTDTTPKTITIKAIAVNIADTNNISWHYRVNNSTSWLSIADGATNIQGGIDRLSNEVTVTGKDLTSTITSITFKASYGAVEDVFTIYKAFDGTDGTPGNPGTPAPLAFLTNENITFPATSEGVITGSTVFTTKVVGYIGNEKVLPTLRTKADGTIDFLDLPAYFTASYTNDTLTNDVNISFTIKDTKLGTTSNASGSFTIPVTSPVNTSLTLTWSKVNAGAQGPQGNSGNDSYTIMLTNESHIFAGDVDHAYESNVETQIIGYKGASQQSVTIKSVDGKTASVNDTETKIAGLKFRCSTLSGQSPTITFTCTESFTSASGAIPIVVSVGGVEFTRMFSYSIAFRGAIGETGGQGIQGPEGKKGDSASLVDVTPSALYFKSTTGKDGTFTPEYIYLYPRFQTVVYGQWEYSTNGGANWNTVYTNNNGLTIGTYNAIANTLRIARTSNLYTDTITSISFRCVSSNTSVYDTVSIAKIYDVVDLQIGGRNYIKNSAQEITKEVGVAQAEYLSLPYDLTPLIEEHGVDQTYTLSFDLKSKNITNNNRINVYPEPGTTPPHKYAFPNTSFVVTQEYQRFSITFKPTRSSNANATLTRISVYGTYDTGNIPVIKNLKLELGNKATDWSPAPEDLKSTTFQLYAPNGYLLTNDVPSITLETFAYDGSQQITNATFAWYSWSGEAWVAITGETGTSLILNKSNVFKSNVYKCDMTYNGKVYTATATVEDKTDIYDSLIHVTSKYSPTNRLYWVLYSTVYSEEGEKDALLGPISVTAPSSPPNGAYWYKIDETNYTVTLMKYSGSAWATTTDKQAFVYDWFMLNDTNNIITLGERSKVKIVTSDNFSRTCSIQCNVLDQELSALTHSNQVLNDPSDPIVSETEPTNPINGQLWIKTSTNGSYMLLVWDASNSKWVISESDSQKKIYVSKPTTYNDGDIWIVAAEYEPDSYINGVLQTEVVNGVTKAVKHLAGTMLRAQYGSNTYKDSDWVDALIYNKELDKLKENLDVYNQFFTFDDTGMTMKAKSLNGQISEFSTKLTNNELGFYQGENKVAYINNNQLNISKAEITNGMTVGGNAPMIQIGNFTIIQESNGSLSIGLKS